MELFFRWAPTIFPAAAFSRERFDVFCPNTFVGVAIFLKSTII